MVDEDVEGDPAAAAPGADGRTGVGVFDRDTCIEIRASLDVLVDIRSLGTYSRLDCTEMGSAVFAGWVVENSWRSGSSAALLCCLDSSRSPTESAFNASSFFFEPRTSNRVLS